MFLLGEFNVHLKSLINIFILTLVSVCNVKGITHYDRSKDKYWTDSADPLSSMENFSIFLTHLDLWPTTELFWLTLIALISAICIRKTS